MRAAPRRSTSLARQYLRWLAGLFLGLGFLTVATALYFVLLPMAERSADDLAGLMVLSAQTWAELPPDTRPVFEAELRTQHQLAIRPGMAEAADIGMRHGFYLRFLELALERRSGKPVFFTTEDQADGSEWLWTTVSAGGAPLGVGFSGSRMNTRPFQALAIVLLAGSLGVGLAAWWLARRIAEPVRALEQAAAQLASGSNPALLPEDGPHELARLARHFNQMATQVRELLDARTTLFAGISHDLRTPLARMRLALEMLTIKPDPALLVRLERDIEEMNTLIGQLLDLARGIGGHHAVAFDLAAWLREHLQKHQAAAVQAGSAISLRCPDALQVFAAPNVLGRVIDNLIGNAIRYAPGAIEVSAQALTGPSPATVRISIGDRGPGIPADQLDQVWRPFQRVEGSRSPRTGGYGLGLAVVQQLAQAQGWQASLRARQGGGLEACIDIPASTHSPTTSA